MKIKLTYQIVLGKNALQSVGSQAGVDKMITGAIENLGKKIVITVKVLDVKTGTYDKIAIEEFINLDTEVQTMMQITMNKALGIENDPELLNNFVYFNQPPEAPVTYIKNNGPRMGMSFVGGDMGQVLKNPAKVGGFDASPIMTQIGYQFEGSYLSAGNFQALIEGLVFLTGVEQNMFNPSFALLNGFRSSKNGWEIGFGPTFRLSRISNGYYVNDETNNDNWRLNSQWEDDPNRVAIDSTERTTWINGQQVGTGEYNYTYPSNPSVKLQEWTAEVILNYKLDGFGLLVKHFILDT